MQHKHYFVALLCGALCLTGCLKNEESASVAGVRNAKANELNAQAELLKAQAGAETTLANAQAELIKAQADLEKAKAKKVQAEAEYQQVLTDLKGVEVQLANVKVAEEKLRLQYMEAELIALKKELEVRMAEADKELAAVLKDLQKIDSEMQTEAIYQQIALLQAENALDSYIAQLAAAEDAAELAEFQNAINMYFWLQRSILEAQITINENQIKIAQNEAADQANYEQLVEDYNDYLAETERIEALIATAEVYITKAEEYLPYDKEALDAAKVKLDTMLITAYNNQLAATTAYGEAVEDAADLKDELLQEDPYTNSIYYYAEALEFYPLDFVNEYNEAYDYYWDFYWDDEITYAELLERSEEEGYYWAGLWDRYYGKGFNYVARSLGASLNYVLVDEEKDAWAWQLGYYDENDEWVVLHTYTYDAGKYAYYSPEVQQYIEGAAEAGIYASAGQWAKWQPVLVPGSTNLEAFNALLDAAVEAEKEAVAEAKADAKEIADALEETLKDQLDDLDATITKTKEYVAEVGPKFEEADALVVSTGEDYEKATEATIAAYKAWRTACINNAKMEEAVADAIATDNVYYEAVDVYNEAVDAYSLNYDESNRYANSGNSYYDIEPDDENGFNKVWQIRTRVPYYEVNGAQLDSVIAAINVEYMEAAYARYYGVYLSGTKWGKPTEAEMATANYNRDKEIAQAKADKAAADKDFTDQIKKDYNDAKAATEKAVKDVQDSAAVVTSTLAAMRAAEVLKIENPTEANEKAYDEAVAAYNKAVEAKGKADAALVEAEKAYKGDGTGTAEVPYNEKKDAVENAEKALAKLQKAAATWETLFNGVANEEDGTEDGVNVVYAAAVEACAEALADVVEAESDMDDALAASIEAWDAVPSNAELAPTEAEAYDKAVEDEAAAEEAYNDAKAAVTVLENTYRHYRQDAEAVYEAETEDEFDGWMIADRKELAEALEALEAEYTFPDASTAVLPYADFIKALDDELAELESAVADFKALLAKYENQYRPAFVKGAEDYNKAEEKVVAAYFAKLEADVVVEYLEGVKNMLVECTFLDEDGTEWNVEAYIKNLEAYIEGLQAQLDKLDEDMDKAIDKYMTDYSYIYANARLELEIEQLQDCITIWQAQLEQYAAIIEAWMAKNAE